MTSLPQAAIIGAGLVGVAAARRLGERGIPVTCVGPDSGQAPYSSHDDSSRITRVLDPDPVWALLAQRGIADYPAIQQRSGTMFHHPVGVLWCASAPAPLNRLADVGEMCAVAVEPGLGGWSDALRIDPDLTLLERGDAGYIEPRAMRRAHRDLAVEAGVRFLSSVVSGIERSRGRWRIDVVGREPLDADLVIVAAGAASGRLVAIDQQVTAEVVMNVTIEAVDDDLDVRSCLGHFDSGGDVDLYFTSPVRTNSGWVMKVGSETPHRVVLDTAEEVEEWMAGNAHVDRTEAMLAELRGLLPELVVSGAVTKPCIYARTASGYPIIDRLDEGLYVASGGNGRMAKSSDAVAGLVVDLAVDDQWDPEFDRRRFSAG